jgi:hypothetical protein
MPWCSIEQDISHRRQPVHFSGSTRRMALVFSGMNPTSAIGYKVAVLYLEKWFKFN